MDEVVLTQVIGLAQTKSDYFIDFRKTIEAKYLTINCNYAPLLVTIDILKNNYLVDGDGISNISIAVTNSNIRWPIKNGRFESMNLSLVKPTIDLDDGDIAKLFLILQFYK